ncbi:hypothetical protein [Myxococcus sp. RHSTA-1-4]|uniref:hypothetical protein n=1 Tax=Myxococcus sp. RHSTA-1-4 TaxID=2874601 RepID=UPI001CBD91B3|nr:hypothetical protein [Myxococcus sp. RHSTA-1-4]MBZ4415903.1 hypothetical protein [Myxococcus sp. RHSTA-1-4]
MRRICLPLLGIIVACTSPRLFYLHGELPKEENDPDLAVAPGPWKVEGISAVLADTSGVPDDLVLPTLRALMALPGAADACDPNTGRPRPDAAEYCVARYRTPDDWRVS